jgi:iron complex outermembrane recepter protein
MRVFHPALISAISLACTVATINPAFGQTVSPPPANPPAANDVVKLSEFNVSAQADRGYVASETMTGSRVATKIVDLPYQVNVLTSEFLHDFAVFELADNVTFIGGFTNLDIGGGFSLRGFGATSQLRDGFYRLGRYGSSNVDRIEIIKGPNAAIYGRTSPGGMMNMISKAPKKQEMQSVEVSHGDYHTDRWVVEATGALTKDAKTYYVFTGSEYQRGFNDIPYARNRNKEYLFAVSHDFADNSHLTLSAEWFLQVRHAPTSSAPILLVPRTPTADNAATTMAIGYAKPIAELNAFGPNSELNRGSDFFTASYDKRFNDVWSIRTAANMYQARRWDYNQNTGFPGTITESATPGTPISVSRGNTPNKRLIFEDGGGFQADLLAHTSWFNHTVESRTLTTLDINDYYRYDPQWNYGSSSNPDIVAWNASTSGRVFTVDPNTLRPTAPLTYFPNWFQWGQEVPSALFRQRTTVFGGQFRQQTAFMQSRLLTYFGARYDDARFKGTDYSPTAPATALTLNPPKWLSAFKPNAGVNYKVTKNLHTYVNYSESYFIDQTTKPKDIAVADFDFETARGWDYGIKGTYLDDQLTFTLGGYYAERKNVKVNDTVIDPITQNTIDISRRDGNQLARGWEADFTWRATPELYAGGSFGNVNSKFTQFGTNTPLATGRTVNNFSPENGSVYLKYSPTGRWNGFSANIMCSYLSSTPTESPSAGDTYKSVAGVGRVLTATTYQWALRVPSVTLWNAGVRYTYRSGHYDHTFAINVNNAFDRDYLKVNKQWGDRRNVIFTYTLQHNGRLF